LLEGDITGADMVIGLCAREHIPMVLRHFPQLLDRFWFWDVEDLDRWPATRALPEIEKGVAALLDDLVRGAEGETQMLRRQAAR
jgi:hypothetical protein